MQAVPISMQALTEQALQQLNTSTFDDYIKYLPNVTTANNGPGQNEVFMRGLSAGSQPSQGSASTGLWPNVAIYLDNQSGQLPRSEEHTSELQSPCNLVCRLLLEKKNSRSLRFPSPPNPLSPPEKSTSFSLPAPARLHRVCCSSPSYARPSGRTRGRCFHQPRMC